MCVHRSDPDAGAVDAVHCTCRSTLFGVFYFHVVIPPIYTTTNLHSSNALESLKFPQLVDCRPL